MTIQITIIGLGQIGASFGLALQTKQESIKRVGHDKELSIARQAEKIKAIDRVESNLHRAVREADVVLLCLPVGQLQETMQLIASTYEDPGQVIELYRNDPNLMRNLQNRVMEEQVIDWIAERANATEQTVSFADVMRPVA